MKRFVVINEMNLFHLVNSGISRTRDAGTGVHYGGTTPLTFERGGNGGTGAQVS